MARTGNKGGIVMARTGNRTRRNGGRKTAASSKSTASKTVVTAAVNSHSLTEEPVGSLSSIIATAAATAAKAGVGVTTTSTNSTAAAVSTTFASPVATASAVLQAEATAQSILKAPESRKVSAAEPSRVHLPNGAARSLITTVLPNQTPVSALPRSSLHGGVQPEAASLRPAYKAIIQEYVTLYNQAEINYRAPISIIKDDDHRLRWQRRLDRVRASEKERVVFPIKSETQASLLRSSESRSGAELSVLLELRITKTVEQFGRRYMEDRRELERLWLTQDGDGIRIARIEPLVLERRPRYGTQQEQNMTVVPEMEDNRNMSSTPYINYDIMSSFKHWRHGATYRRDLAAAYADRWWNEPNPEYENFEVNCTNYVSQCLFAGQAPMNYTGKRDSGWWYRGFSSGRELWSYSWAVSNSLQHYLSTPRNKGLQATAVESPEQLSLGDVILYDWGGDGRYQHSVIVTAFDTSGMPLVNANTVASRHRYWDYRDSYAWTEHTRYRFFHIADEL